MRIYAYENSMHGSIPSGASRFGVFGMPKQNINSIRTYIKVSTLFTMTAKPMHVPGYAML